MGQTLLLAVLYLGRSLPGADKRLEPAEKKSTLLLTTEITEIMASAGRKIVVDK